MNLSLMIIDDTTYKLFIALNHYCNSKVKESNMLNLLVLDLSQLFNIDVIKEQHNM